MCPNGVLLGHVTGARTWDIPKGGIELDEDALSGAKRELLEETGLTLTGPELICKFSGARYPVTATRDLGRHSYTKRKDLHLFVLMVPVDINAMALKCESMVERPTYSFPEFDGFALVNSGLNKHLSPALYAWLKAHM